MTSQRGQSSFASCSLGPVLRNVRECVQSRVNPSIYLLLFLEQFLQQERGQRSCPKVGRDGRRRRKSSQIAAIIGNGFFALTFSSSLICSPLSPLPIIIMHLIFGYYLCRCSLSLPPLITIGTPHFSDGIQFHKCALGFLSTSSSLLPFLLFFCA